MKIVPMTDIGEIVLYFPRPLDRLGSGPLPAMVVARKIGEGALDLSVFAGPGMVIARMGVPLLERTAIVNEDSQGGYCKPRPPATDPVGELVGDLLARVRVLENEVAEWARLRVVENVAGRLQRLEAIVQALNDRQMNLERQRQHEHGPGASL